MTDNTLPLRETIVFISALVYWVGVVVNIYRVRRHIGRSPNIKPAGFKERLLWTGWFIVIAVWITQPLVIGKYSSTSLFSFIPSSLNNYGLLTGIILVALGYAGTLWCYSALGDSWRIGVNKKETTSLIEHGPYRTIRHPIYLFQILMLTGAAFLLSTLFSIMIIIIHFICILIKSLDEEAYLLGRHGPEYRKYLSRTGRFFPKF